MELRGELTRGMTVADLRPAALARALDQPSAPVSNVVWRTDVDAVRELILEAVLTF